MSTCVRWSPHKELVSTSENYTLSVVAGGEENQYMSCGALHSPSDDTEIHCKCWWSVKHIM